MFHFFSGMEDIRILINCSGLWKGNIYNDGYLEMIFMSRNLTYKTLLVMVHEIICVDLNSCVYELRTLLDINNKMARFKIKDDTDVQYVLGERDGIPRVYVTV